MTTLAIATVIAWGVSLWCAASAVRSRGLLRKLRRALAATAAAALGILLAALLLITQAFTAFSRETLVARITAERLGRQGFSLTYRPAEAEGPGETFRLRGDQWAVSGGIVKWHPWLSALGFPSYHKPTRVMGRFSDPAQERVAPTSIGVLHEGADRLWEWCYRASPYLPFVEAVYGSAAYVYVEPDVVAELYVTPSGYLIKRIKYPRSEP